MLLPVLVRPPIAHLQFWLLLRRDLCHLRLVGANPCFRTLAVDHWLWSVPRRRPVNREAVDGVWLYRQWDNHKLRLKVFNLSLEMDIQLVSKGFAVSYI
jgi:hypothetical protein